MTLDFIKKGVLPAIVSQLPLAVLHKWSGSMPLLPYYHGISDDQPPHIKHLYRFRNTREFKRDLEVFLKYYKPITLHELLANLEGNKSLPTNWFLLTFDDGFREMHDIVAPILWEKGLSATFFIIKSCVDNADMVHHNKISVLLEHLNLCCSKPAEAAILGILAECGIHDKNAKAALLRVSYAKKDVLKPIADVLGFDFGSYLSKEKPYLASEQLRKLIDMGFTIGGHSIDHPVFGVIPLEEQLRQTRESVRFLRNRFELSYGAFSFPHHDAQVGREFFSRIQSEGGVHIFFGTSGMVREEFQRHFQRFPMEKMSAEAEKILAYNYARSMQRKLSGGHLVVRE